MIVDDERDILNLFKDYLEMKAWKVKTFQNPDKALSEIKVNHRHYSLIITDIRMPQMSGIEFIQRVNKIDSDIKIVFMTAFEMDKAEIKEMGKEELLNKPIKIQNLVTIINRILKSQK
jgi:two-component system nitrogen regulation response regulator GlnG